MSHRDHLAERLRRAGLSEQAVVNNLAAYDAGDDTGREALRRLIEARSDLWLRAELGDATPPPPPPQVVTTATLPDLLADLGGGGYSDEQARDAAAAMLVAGTNVSLAKDDDGNTVTINAAAGGGGLDSLIDRPGLPSLTKLEPTVATRAQVGLGTIYTQFLMRVPESVRTAHPTLGQWRIYTSTDHDNTGAGGIAMLHTDAQDPTAPGASWSFYRTGGGAVSIHDEGGTSQTETPWLVWNPVTAKFHMYYQIRNGTIQRTRVVTSADGVTGWSAPVDALPNLPDGVAGYEHTGYARVWYLDGLWCAWSTIGSFTGGGGGYGWSYSYDGITFITDRRRYTAALQDTDGTLRIGFSGLFTYRGGLWATGQFTQHVGGSGATSDVTMPFIAPLNDDLLSIKGRPQLLDWPLITGELADSPPGLPSNWADLGDGRLVGAYRVNGASRSTDFIRLAVLA